MSCRAVAGVWSRLFEEDPLGDEANADRTTLVLWTQTPSGIYVDLRLPQGSPGRSTGVNTDIDTENVDSKNPTALRATGICNSVNKIDILSAQKSFAGVLEYKVGDTTKSKEALAKDTVLKQLAKNPQASLPLCTCFWRRDIDYQPPSGGLDIGVCASYSEQGTDGSVDLRETGDDGSYAEGWHRLANTCQGPFMALTLVSENGHERTGFWVQTGNCFAYAIGRPKTEELAKALQVQCPAFSASIQSLVGKTLSEVVQSMADHTEEDKLAIMTSYVGLAGTIDPKSGNWCILDTTNPDLKGCHLVGNSLDNENCCSILEGPKEQQVKEGDLLEQVLCGEGAFVRKWKVVELSEGCTPPFLNAST